MKFEVWWVHWKDKEDEKPLRRNVLSELDWPSLEDLLDFGNVSNGFRTRWYFLCTGERMKIEHAWIYIKDGKWEYPVNTEEFGLKKYSNFEDFIKWRGGSDNIWNNYKKRHIILVWREIDEV